MFLIALGNELTDAISAPELDAGAADGFKLLAEFIRDAKSLPKTASFVLVNDPDSTCADGSLLDETIILALDEAAAKGSKRRGEPANECECMPPVPGMYGG